MRLQRRLLHDFLLQHTLRAEDDARRYLAVLGAKGYDNLLALKLRVQTVEDFGELGVDKVRAGGGVVGVYVYLLCMYVCVYVYACNYATTALSINHTQQPQQPRHRHT